MITKLDDREAGVQFVNPIQSNLSNHKYYNFRLQVYDCTTNMINSIIVFHLSKLSKAKFSILCDVIILARQQGEIEVDHSWD